MREKILYGCSFVPYMTLQAEGFDMVSLYDLAPGLYGGQKLGGNLCSFVQRCSQIDFSQFSGVILTNCCNSVQRLYDYIRFHYPKLFLYLLEIPRDRSGVNGYKSLFKSLKQYFRKEISEFAGRLPEKKESSGRCIQVVSSALSKKYVQALSEVFGGFYLKFSSCSSDCRGDRLLQHRQLAVSCPRRTDFYDWFETAVQWAIGVIYIVSQRCDHIMFPLPELRALCRRQSRRMLFLEEEYTNKISENSRLRYEAFRECLLLERR